MAPIVSIAPRSFACFLAKNYPKIFNPVLTVPARGVVITNRDWKPGPFPKTEKERVAAAKKYNLLPEDYKPYPDDGEGEGDYPDIPLVSLDARDPYEVYDYPVLKRNFGEPMHRTIELYGHDRHDATTRLKVAPWKRILFLVGVTCALAVGLFGSPVFEPNILEKQYPKEGVKHYTFEKP